MEIQLSGAFTNWKTLAREALRAGVPPADISWTEQEGQQDLFTAGGTATSEANAIAITPRGAAQRRARPS